ncbi:MAG: hypothetical protein HRT88_05085 [Lentisphaeraceae bacterium]|nr:hypothetical protein [Lentisphaeraceae bacterium]
MKLFAILVLFVVASFTTGCQNTIASKIGAPITAITKTVIAEPLVEVGDAISGTASETKLFTFAFGGITFGPSEFASGTGLPTAGPLGRNVIASVQQAAIYQACKSASCDMILAPSYITKKDSFLFFTKLTCTVNGYAGYVKGIKSITTDYVLSGSKEEKKKSILPF